MQHLGHVPAPVEKRGRPRIEWMVKEEPHTEGALAYGFCAIAAFVLGGVGYLSGVLSAWGLGGSVLLAFITFVLSYRHMERS
jgi:ABC-type glucose/galactose transport system permease subunit